MEPCNTAFACPMLAEAFATGRRVQVWQSLKLLPRKLTWSVIVVCTARQQRVDVCSMREQSLRQAGITHLHSAAQGLQLPASCLNCRVFWASGPGGKPKMEGSNWITCRTRVPHPNTKTGPQPKGCNATSSPRQLVWLCSCSGSAAQLICQLTPTIRLSPWLSFVTKVFRRRKKQGGLHVVAYGGSALWCVHAPNNSTLHC